MSDVKESIVNEELESIKAELEAVKGELNQYKAAYERLVEQNNSVWGLYSNTIDYVVANTTRKDK